MASTTAPKTFPETELWTGRPLTEVEQPKSIHADRVSNAEEERVRLDELMQGKVPAYDPSKDAPKAEKDEKPGK